jgi:hypothetical protein
MTRWILQFECVAGEKENERAVDLTLSEASPILRIHVAGRILACLASSESHCAPPVIGVE